VALQLAHFFHLEVKWSESTAKGRDTQLPHYELEQSWGEKGAMGAHPNGAMEWEETERGNAA